MTKIQISTEEYNELFQKLISLRELVSQLEEKFKKLEPVKRAKIKGPNIRKAEELSKMTHKEMQEYFKKTIK